MKKLNLSYKVLVLVGLITFGSINLQAIEATKTIKYSEIEGLEYIVLDATENGIFIEIDGTIYFVQK